MPGDQRAQLEGRRTHLDAERLHFGTSGNGTAVIVRQHQDRHPFQLPVKDPLAAHVEIVAVNERERRGGKHGDYRSERTMPTTTPQISAVISSPMMKGG